VNHLVEFFKLELADVIKFGGHVLLFFRAGWQHFFLFQGDDGFVLDWVAVFVPLSRSLSPRSF